MDCIEILYASGNVKKYRVTILTLKIDFEIKLITKIKEWHYIMIKSSFINRNS